MKHLSFLKFFVMVLLLGSTLLVADEVTDGINEALKDYKAQDYKGAVAELKYVTATLRSLEAKENQKLLPLPLSGWKLETENNNQQQAMMAMIGAGTSINGTYTKDKARVEIEITSNSPMTAMISMGINNPAIIASEPGTKPYRYKKAKGIHIKRGNENKIMLLLPGNIMLSLSGENLSDDTVLEQYLEKVDFKLIKEKLL